MSDPKRLVFGDFPVLSEPTDVTNYCSGAVLWVKPGEFKVVRDENGKFRAEGFPENTTWERSDSIVRVRTGCRVEIPRGKPQCTPCADAEKASWLIEKQRRMDLASAAKQAPASSPSGWGKGSKP